MASAEQPPAAAAKVSKSTIESAVTALLKYKAAQSATEKLQLLPQDDYIYLTLTLNKIPSKPRTNPFKIPLSHPLLHPNTSQLCLIIDDRPKSHTPPSDQIKKLIKSHNIPISKVIKVSKLKTNYKPFEAKRKLCDSYDLFLVDKRVVHLMPKMIGKEFFKKKKLPLGVDLSKSNLKLQVERDLGSALLYLRSGTCCVMKVGKVAMDKDEIVANAFDAIMGGVERVVKKWDGVRSLHLKFQDSVALPVYQALPDVKLKIEGLGEVEKGAEISGSEGEVKKIRSGRKDCESGKKTRKKKGRIHEVRYMDVGEDNVDEDEQVRSEDKRENLNLMEDVSKKIEDEDLSINTTVGKKRNKGKALKEEVLGEEKRVKKSEKDESGKPAGNKGKRKSELAEKPVEKIAKLKDTKHKKKRVFGK